MLAKAAGRIPLGGGVRIRADSDDYRVLHDWIRAGAPGPDAHEARLQRISVLPDARVLPRLSTQPLQVTAHFSDGRTQNVTPRALFESNAPDVADVDQLGLVSTLSSGGMFAVMVRYGGQVGVFRGTVPIGTPHDALDEGDLDDLRAIDRHLVNQWRQLGVVPSPPADDATFIRRVHLDMRRTRRGPP